MKRPFYFGLLCLLFWGCNNSFYTAYDNKRSTKDFLYETVRLDKGIYDSLKVLLTHHSQLQLTDTVLIRYTSSGDNCWSYWDTAAPSKVQSMINWHNYLADSIVKSRPGLSFYSFRAPGNKFSKPTLLNSRVRIDSTNWLFRNLIKRKAECGTSVAIFPDRTTLRILVDPHFELLRATSAEWENFKREGLKNNN